jgi:hypothetical protein
VVTGFSTTRRPSLPAQPSIPKPSYFRLICRGKQYPQLPFITPVYTSLGFQTASKDPSTVYRLFGDVVKIIVRDTLKLGVDARQYRVDVTNYGAAAGTFTFASNFVQSSSSGSAPTFGGPEASFLLDCRPAETSSTQLLQTFTQIISPSLLRMTGESRTTLRLTLTRDTTTNHPSRTS